MKSKKLAIFIRVCLVYCDQKNTFKGILMSHIIDFVITGLTGRSEAIECTLNRDVNIFYGSNGAGKTSLLKILTSSLQQRTKSLQNVIFDKAMVRIYSNDLQMALKYEVSSEDIKKEKDKINCWRMTEGPAVVPYDYWDHAYLPTSRLYSRIPNEFVLTRYETRESSSDEDLNERFALLLQSRWEKQNAETQRAVREFQASGLASILKVVFDDNSYTDVTVLDSKLAYERVNKFLSRQDEIELSLGSLSSFEKKISADHKLRSIVKQIDTVEEKIEILTARKDKLQDLLNKLFSNKKKIIFENRKIEAKQGELNIDISLMSSGEKQILRILLEVYLCSSNSFIIDEPEISMHIDWQRVLITSILDLSPEIQFICATHSPEIMADVADEKIFKI